MQFGCRRSGRKKLGISHAKLREVLRQDFVDCPPLATVISSPVGLVPGNALVFTKPVAGPEVGTLCFAEFPGTTRFPEAGPLDSMPLRAAGGCGGQRCWVRGREYLRSGCGNG